jgi:competence protein ComEC
MGREYRLIIGRHVTTLVLFSLGWIAGIWAAAQLNQPAWAWLAFSGLAAASLILLRAERRLRQPWLPRLPLMCALALGLGAARYEAGRPPLGDPHFVATYNEAGGAILDGVIADDPQTKDGQVTLHVAAETILPPAAAEPIAVDGLVLVTSPDQSASRLAATGDASFQYGDRVRVYGALETPPIFEGFSYRDRLARFGVYAQVRQASISFLAARAGNPGWQALHDFRAYALTVVARLFPEPATSLLAGILLGDATGISPELQSAFAATNTAHIIAISGFNISILIAVFMAGARPVLGARRSVYLAIIGVVLYTLLVGAGASVVRAAIMSSLALVAGRLGRRSWGLNTLAAAALVMTLQNPLVLWDVGFQLTGAATLGILLYGQRLQAWVEASAVRRTTPQRAHQIAGAATDLFLLTFAAQLTTLPLLVTYFRQFSVVALLANFVILPAQPGLEVASGLALLLGLVWLPLGQVAAWLAWPFSTYTIAFVEFFAHLPNAAFALGETAPALVAVYYAVLFGLTWVLARPAPQRPEWWGRALRQSLPVGGLLVLGAGALVVWSLYFSLPTPGRLRLTLLDVGSVTNTSGRGEAVLIQSPAGGTVLVDGGPGALTLERALATQLPVFRKDLDVLVVTATGDEIIGALPDTLDLYHPQRVVITRAPGRSATYRTLRQKLIDQGIETVDASTLPRLDLGSGISLTVLADTATGSVLRLAWGKFSLVMAPALDAAGETILLNDGLAQPATALLLANSGSTQSTSDAYLATLNPRLALISVGAGNPDGNPSPVVLARLAGRDVLRTDQHGAIMVETDGAQMWMTVSR